MRRIEIDDEVYAWLEKRARGFEVPNDVLRRELLGDSQPATSSPLRPVPPVTGGLYPLIAAGLIQPGDTLSCHRTRQGITYKAEVLPDGFIRTERGTFRAPSPALKAYVQTEVDGWASWMHDQSGKRLRDLRAEGGMTKRGA